MATRAPEQTTSEASPAPAASTTRSQTLRTAPPKARPDRAYGNLVRRRAPRSRSELETERACLPRYSPKCVEQVFSEVRRASVLCFKPQSFRFRSALLLPLPSQAPRQLGESTLRTRFHRAACHGGL